MRNKMLNEPFPLFQRARAILKTKMPKWRDSEMMEAVARVQAKELSLNKAAKLYGIPVATLHRHVNTAGEIKPGRPTTLTYTEEREIAYSCQVYTYMQINDNM